ncbi:uncharacterized protein [Aristolochia californica]|uniref:uncharacterized protein n=1 Tax=Aristolochia californica TaxID=171875 RepID=UPI0035E21335
MLITLSVKNKVGFVDSSIPKPQEIFANIIFVASDREIWLDLQDCFQQRNRPLIFQLKRELINLRQDQNSVSIYFTKLKTIWEELSNYHPNCSCGKCSCGGIKNLIDYHHIKYIISFLMRLDDSFSQVHG